ncbi:unnamed protein product [Rotaria magnacalcarata]|uniref:Wall-associated receptor kinase galacturonan-binding domain-containing protein n=1 Tax=Rotaria magnacalcarata TaxID=392030 RepID=A0A820HPC3_9BILA|nr:unnamed protein product [Rotaria magnacalcarata]
MRKAKTIIIGIILQILLAELASSQTCSYMWDPVFELSSSNQPMCPVSTTSGFTCSFPFKYNGLELSLRIPNIERITINKDGVSRYYAMNVNSRHIVTGIVQGVCLWNGLRRP